MNKTYHTNLQEFAEYSLALGETLKLSYRYLCDMLDTGNGDIAIAGKTYKPSEVLIKTDSKRFWSFFRQVSDEHIRFINSCEGNIDDFADDTEEILGKFKTLADERSGEIVYSDILTYLYKRKTVGDSKNNEKGGQTNE